MSIFEIVEKKISLPNQKALAWLVIQSSRDGNEDGEWEDMWPEDLPEWVMHPDVIAKMMDGKLVCADPSKKTRWYRAVRASNPSAEVEH